MHVLILGGQNPRHARWVRDFAAVVRAKGHRADFIDYDNWASDSPATDVPHELDAVAEAAKRIHEPYAIAAKSIGTIITTFGVERGELSPSQVLLLGFPLNEVRRDAEIGGAAQLLPLTTVIQNESDPFGTAENVAQFFAEHGPESCEVESVPANATHDYLDFDRYVEVLEANDSVR